MSLHTLLIISLLVLASCSKDKIEGIVKQIPPLTTNPIVVHNLNSCTLPTDTFPVRWDTSQAGEPTKGTTVELPAEPYVCHDVADVQALTAWVRHLLPLELDEALQHLQNLDLNNPSHREHFIHFTTNAIASRFELLSLLPDMTDTDVWEESGK